jgi:hypothetical protein
MPQIRVLGAALTPEFLGVAADGQRITDEAEGFSQITWTFTSTGGARGLYVRYAGQADPPCKLILGKTTVQRQALFETIDEAADWRYQTTVEVPAGVQRIALRTTGELPAIEAIAVAAPPEGRAASVDEAHAALLAETQRSRPRRPLSFRPVQLAGLVDAARAAGSDPAAAAQLTRLVDRMMLAVRLDSADGSARMAWGGGPMNGQRRRQEIFSHLMALDIDAIVETGAYIGSSTAHFARQGVPVFACDVDHKFLARAAVHLAELANVTLSLDDSRSFLRTLAVDRAFSFERPLFYLDAHWEEDLPLADEIRIITGRWPSFVIMVDDFEVPGSDYAYDRYPNGLELTLGYLERERVPLEGLAVLFPTASAEAETGAKRGTLILMPAELYEQRMRMDRTVFRHEGRRP